MPAPAPARAACPPYRRAVASTRCHSAGPGQVDGDHVGAPAQQRVSGPISAPAPSTTTVRRTGRSQSGLAGDRADGLGARRLDDRRRSTQASSWRRRSSPRSRSPRYGSDSSRSRLAGARRPSRVPQRLAGGLADDPVHAWPTGTSASGVTNRIRSYSDARPSRAIVSAASRESRPASTSRRKCTRYSRRQLVSPSAPRAPTGSTARARRPPPRGPAPTCCAPRRPRGRPHPGSRQPSPGQSRAPPRRHALPGHGQIRRRLRRRINVAFRVAGDPVVATAVAGDPVVATRVAGDLPDRGFLRDRGLGR